MRTQFWRVIVSVTIAAASAARGDFVLVGEGVTPAPILYDAEIAGSKRAAETLADYLGKISGAEFAATASSEDPPARAVVVGAPTGTLPEGLGRDGYSIRVDNERMALGAPSPVGLMYAVFGFLEDRLGCRWWSWNEEDVPARKDVRLPEFEQVVRPPFALHNLMNKEAQNKGGNFSLKSRSTSSVGFSGSHSLYPMLTPYAKDHPEIYPMNKEGERKANKLHFCYLADGIAQALVDRITAMVEKDPAAISRRIYFAGMGDWYGGMCECEACAAVYKEETWTDEDGRDKPGYSATLLRMINRAAESLEVKYPGIRIGTFAYMSLEAPPAITVPRENVIIRVPRLRHCTVHAVSECDKNQSYYRNLQRWSELGAGRVYIWEYGTNFKSFIYPFPCVRSIAGNIRLYHEMGLAGVMVQGNYVTTGSDLVVLKNYVFRKLMWDPVADVDTLLRDFCTGYYGPAADAALNYVNALESGVREPEPIHANEFATPGYLHPPVRERLAQLRGVAIAAAGQDEVILRRVKELTVGIEVLKMDRRLPFIDGETCLEREGVDGCTFERAIDAIQHVRNSGNNEWTTGKSYWWRFLASQGGPLVSLTGGDVAVRVAPLLGGRLWSLKRRGVEFLSVQRELSEKVFVTEGGSAVSVGKNPFMRAMGIATDAGVTLEDGMQIDGWRFSTQPTFSQRVTVDEDGTVIMTVVPKAAQKSPTVGTTYRVGADASTFSLFAEQSKISGQSLDEEASATAWEPVGVLKSGDELILNGVSAVRLSRSDLKVVLTDRYVMAGPVTLKVAYDTEAGTIFTEALIEKLVPGDLFTGELVRTITVTDMP